MNLKHNLFNICYLLFSIQLCSVFAAEQPPNIVVIFADDLGYGDLSCYGASKVKTPNIDKLANEGRLFRDAHSASAMCTPSRYALMTGEYPFRKKIEVVYHESNLLIKPDTLTVSSLLKRAGYTTACIGKWHLGFGNKQNPDWNKDLKPGPLELGFDYYFGIPVVNSHPPYVYVENHRVLGLVPEDPMRLKKRKEKATPTPHYPFKVRNPFTGGRAAHALYRDEDVATTFTQKATQWIRDNRSKPFFLYFPTTNIHFPYTPQKKFKGTSDCGLYGDYIHELDWVVGEITKTLKETKLDQNTLVIVTSDNGPMLSDGGRAAWRAGHKLSGPLLGFKSDSWEGGHRVPFIARWPGKIEAGSESSQLICSIDFLATFAALTGQSLSKDQSKDSVNILPALLGNPTEPVREHLLTTARFLTHFTVRQNNWLYISCQGSGGFLGNSKQVAFAGPQALPFTGRTNSDIDKHGKIKPDAPVAQLYDLEADLAQTKNLYRQKPEKVQEMQALLKKIKNKVIE